MVPGWGVKEIQILLVKVGSDLTCPIMHARQQSDRVFLILLPVLTIWYLLDERELSFMFQSARHVIYDQEGRDVTRLPR